MDSLHAEMSPAFRADAGGRSGIVAFVERIRSRLGEERTVIREEIYDRLGPTDYYRISRFSDLDALTVTVHWVWEEDGTVVGGRISPTPQPAHTDYREYRTKTRLTLPFRGRWYVAWGGREPHRNQHVTTLDQRFAYDFLIVRDGASHRDAGRRNGDYFCFGEPVLAPAPGRVVAAVDTLPDNEPGETDGASPAGNHVVIDHGGGEYSLLAHLRRGSVAASPGEDVERGERIGECGNSGHSTEPNLHYHLQVGAEFGKGVGLPAQFVGYRADGERVERGEPVRGQFVRPAREPGDGAPDGGRSSPGGEGGMDG